MGYVSPTIDGFRSTIAACLPKTLTDFGFAAQSLVPACDPVISIIDSVCESDSDFVALCLDKGIPVVMMQQLRAATSDDSACACLQLLANFVRSAPDRSPLYPEFVADVSRTVTWFLDDVIPLAWFTWQECPAPEPWFEFAERIVGMCVHPAFEMAPQAKAHTISRILVFYASCFSHGFLQYHPHDLSNIGILVPMFCDLLPLTDCYQESLLELTSDMSQTLMHDIIPNVSLTHWTPFDSRICISPPWQRVDLRTAGPSSSAPAASLMKRKKRHNKDHRI
jgi:hypothetical protein